MVARWVVGLLVACGACADDYVIKVGLTEFPGPEMTKLAVPERAAVGARFVVSVTTVGGGCIEPVDTQLTLTRDDALVVPRDEYYVGDEYACTLELRYLRHDVAIRFDTPGTKTIIIRGRREKPITAGSRKLVDEILEYPFAVVVE